MPKKKPENGQNTLRRRSRTAFSPEARENQMIALAIDLAEKQLREGTAASSVITHYLKLGSKKRFSKSRKTSSKQKQRQ